MSDPNQTTELEREPTAHAEQVIQPAYLGDAVYASFDGYQIWLKTGDGNNQQIALEPSVYFSLRQYAKRIWGDNARERREC